jgi:cytochrome c553
MKNIYLHTILLASALLCFTPLQAIAATPADYTAGIIAGGVANTKHNLGSTGRLLSTKANVSPLFGTSEVCVFCHTPHHGSTNAPLWNKGEQTTTYITYGTTLAGTSVDSQPGGATLACLSCHDGVNTFDTIVNFPGKGGTSKTDMGWIFGMPGGSDSPGLDHFNTDPIIPPAGTGICAICHGTTGLQLLGQDGEYSSSNPADHLSVGTDLTNDHPVSVSYNAGTAGSLRATTTVLTSISMKNDVITVNDESDSKTTTSNRWAVNGYINAPATIADLLRNGKVECSSCHDPHFDNMSWDETDATYNPEHFYWCGGATEDGEDCSDGLFLRRIGGNSLSGVCRTCHNK